MDWKQILKQGGHRCAICRRGKLAFPGIKLVPDTRVVPTSNQQETRVLCSVCKKAIDAWPEATLMFQAIMYLRGGI